MSKELHDLVLLVQLQGIYNSISEAIAERNSPPAEIRELQESNRLRQEELEEMERQMRALGYAGGDEEEASVAAEVQLGHARCVDDLARNRPSRLAREPEAADAFGQKQFAALLPEGQQKKFFYLSIDFLRDDCGPGGLKG